ncbi:hypothetical protein GCK72_008146 [Caenorhabditis remanei]|uniref:Uncharacterized protein n=1 Tax=Caenorhabditis remanei TaxID=31234 RepID=A0A6A5HNL3_CAERE|nr:hypothetical protein GCK72_008146 [Caenorhabditis remanei]KAF1768184.1 hypothetical protein GCK72_008146 [Caenorhabditis remanei]
MDIWVPLLSDRLESPNFEFKSEFIGGDCIIQINAVLIKNDSFFGHITVKEKTGRLIVAARIRKMLCELDLSKPSGSRQFIVQNFENQVKDGLIYYVNLAKLGQIGGDLFKKWQTVEDVQLISTTTESMENRMIETLMEATARYDDLVVIRHGVHRLIRLAQKYRMHKLMRVVEEYILETKLINWDEKILIALQYRMSPLYMQVERKYLKTPWQILCRIQRLYLSTYARQSHNSSNPYELIHKNLLQLVMASDENIFIG